MNILYWAFMVLLIGFSSPLKAQLSERFVVISKDGKPAETKNKTDQPLSYEDAELLVSSGSGQEAAVIFSELIVQYHFLKDSIGLDRACTGLYRTQLLNSIDSKYADKLKLCRPEVLSSLSGKTDWEPMFITPPIFKADENWENYAKPGTIYKVTVQFDIDEYGNPDNFNFNADDKMYLKYPVIENLKQARYLPAVKDGKAIKKPKNIVEVTFCLDRGSSCAHDN